MKWALVISSGDPETVFNALRLGNTAIGRGDEVSVFMLGRAVDYEELSSSDFDLVSQVEKVQEGGDFYV